MIEQPNMFCSMCPYHMLNIGELMLLHDSGNSDIRIRAEAEVRRRWRDIPSFKDLLKFIAQDVIDKFNLK